MYIIVVQGKYKTKWIATLVVNGSMYICIKFQSAIFVNENKPIYNSHILYIKIMLNGGRRGEMKKKI